MKMIKELTENLDLMAKGEITIITIKRYPNNPYAHMNCFYPKNDKYKKDVNSSQIIFLGGKSFDFEKPPSILGLFRGFDWIVEKIIKFVEWLNLFSCKLLVYLLSKSRTI